MVGADTWKEVLYGNRKPEGIPEENWDEFIGAFPYFSNAYILKAKALHDQSNIHFSESLSSAAARTLSRKVLKKWIEGPGIMEVYSGPRPEIPVIDAAPEEPVSVKKQDTFVGEFPSEKKHETQNPEITSVKTQEIVGTEKAENQEHSQPQPPSLGKNTFGFRFVKATKKKNTQKEKSTEKIYDVQKLETGKPLKKKEQKDPIDLFLEKSPSISSPRIDFGNPEPQPDLSAHSTSLNEEIITENMALIYLKQKNYGRALDIYRKLELKFPEKSAYFAALIKNLENNIT